MKKLLSALMSLSLLAGAAAMPAAAAETYSLGDANTDGVVDGRDSMFILCDYVEMFVRHSFADEANAVTAEGHNLNAEQLTYADVDGDGYVNCNDAHDVLEYYVYRLVAENPVSPETFFADSAPYNDEAKQSENLDEAVDQAIQEGKDYLHNELT